MNINLEGSQKVMVKRYVPDVEGEGYDFGDASPCMAEEADGDYVKATDYDALAARLAECESDGEDMRQVRLNLYEERDQYKARLAHAEACLVEKHLRLAERENMIRDLCIDHVDNCICRYCTAVFRVAAQKDGAP